VQTVPEFPELACQNFRNPHLPYRNGASAFGASVCSMRERLRQTEGGLEIPSGAQSTKLVAVVPRQRGSLWEERAF
jgi:hypothetical protein